MYFLNVSSQCKFSISMYLLMSSSQCIFSMYLLKSNQMRNCIALSLLAVWVVGTQTTISPSISANLWLRHAVSVSHSTVVYLLQFMDFPYWARKLFYHPSADLMQRVTNLFSIISIVNPKLLKQRLPRNKIY